ncbi:unnamed protein product, partial [marine sediment metagenome]
MKRCTKCGELKDEYLFRSRTQCKECKRQYNKQ